MAVSMYTASVPVFLQLLGGLKTVLQKAETHATEQKWDTAAVLNQRFFPDMFTFERQGRQGFNPFLRARPRAGLTPPAFPHPDKNFSPKHVPNHKDHHFL